MERIMGIDYGTKRVGIAVTDPMQIIATGLQTVATHLLFEFLEDYFSRENVKEIVIGYPKKMNNQPSDAVKHIDPFIRRLKKLYPEKEIILADERFTSKIAFQTMIDAGLKKKQRQNKELVDKISATLILQDYLEKKNDKIN